MMLLKGTTTTTLDSRSAVLDPRFSILHPRSSILNPPSFILHPRSSPRGFTLIELMISIALVLLLILGVNQVFTYTTQAVGAGEAINSAIRLSRAAQSQFAADFSAIVPNGGGPNDSACMIIACRSSYAFSNAKDQAAQGQTSGSNSYSGTLPAAAFLDLQGSGNFGDPNVNGDTVFPSTYNLRNHRLDIISFFARGLFHRQTGNPGTFVDDLSSQEAWIWYGHLQLPDNSGNFPSATLPCIAPSATNPNNYFGSKLVLGRMAMLLRQTNGPGQILDNQNSPQWFVANSGNLDPLGGNAKLNQTAASTGSEPTAYTLPQSRVDLGNATIAAFRDFNFKNYTSTSPPWYDLMMDGVSNTASLGRFQCSPFVSKPMTSRDMAQATPYFVGGCSQFMVEFAGDFLTQDNDPSHLSSTNSGNRSNYGDVNSLAPDGQIDFTIVNGVKQIKWYGMPRGTSGSGTIRGSNGDVVPLRDWLQKMTNADGTAGAPVTNAAFEKYLPSYQDFQTGDYKLKMSQAEAATGYTCAFGPNDPHPKLIRITMTLDDPTGRLPEGQTYQYVYALP